MEYCEGGNLWELVTETKITDQEMVTIMIQLFKAIKHIHSINMIHTNIRLENILLVKKGECSIKLTGFGNAKRPGTFIEKDLGKNVHTPIYMPPEMIESKGKDCSYDFSADIWSMGVVMYILCYNKSPFFSSDGRPNSSEMRKRIKNGDYEINQGNIRTVEVKNLITRMLVVDKYRRIKIDDILKTKWFIQT